MSDHDELTRPNKNKSKPMGYSEDLFQQMQNSKIKPEQFTKRFANDVLGPKTGALSVEGESKGPLASRMGAGSIQSADFMGNIQWTPMKKIITFLLTGGSFAAIIVALYLSGLKGFAIMVAAFVMLTVLIAYLIHWIFKG